eukprot:1151341-Pelagomonas_calceolata.AAC.3
MIHAQICLQRAEGGEGEKLHSKMRQLQIQVPGKAPKHQKRTANQQHELGTLQAAIHLSHPSLCVCSASIVPDR